MLVKRYILCPSINYAGNVHLDRAEAVALVKELISLHLVQPSLISIEKNTRGAFSLIMKIDGDLQGIKHLIAEKNLAIEEDKEKGYFIIFEP
jgi:hypothetical protein